MRRAGSRTADGWWLLLITVLGWLLVSYGGHQVFGESTSAQILAAALYIWFLSRSTQSNIGTDVLKLLTGSQRGSSGAQRHDIERRQLQTTGKSSC